MIIHVEWCGPFNRREIGNCKDPRTDFGVYQIYGYHPIYGKLSLIYIGKARDRTFALRIIEHPLDLWEQTGGPIEIHLGRLHGVSTPDVTDWCKQIDWVETLLIYAHKPSHNSQLISDFPYEMDKVIEDIHILNYGSYRSLLPEVSGARWSSKYDILPNYNSYGAHQ
jgi:hypothetical protein